MSNKEYTCEGCGQTFKSRWTDEQALSEKERMWGDVPIEECSILCHECNNKFLEWMKTHGGTA